MASTSIFCSIVYKFYYEQVFYPVILPLIVKNLEINLHYIVQFLGIAIYLKIEGGKRLLLDIKKIVWWTPEL